MYRIYASPKSIYNPPPTRIGGFIKSLEAAMKKAAELEAALTEVRYILPNGQERIQAIFLEGKQV